MTDASEPQSVPPPIVPDAHPQEIASGVYVIADERIPLVPNVGIIVGEQQALVVDTGIGPQNGRRVLEKARALTDTPLVLTTTHFHPEHSFGAQAFRGEKIFYNRVQRDELLAKGAAYNEMFRTFGQAVADELEGFELVEPHDVYDGSTGLELGGITADLHETGLAHTRGDQFIFLPEERILFTGDLVETRLFPILPWFPPNDVDVDGIHWIEVLDRLEALEPEIVVPGHGEVGDVSLIRAIRSHLEHVRQLVQGVADEATLEDVKAKLEPEIRAAYPTWDAPEWIGFAIEYFFAESRSSR